MVENLSLVSDGMYKLAFDDVCVISFGTALKDSVWHRNGHHTTFVELIMCFCKSEKAENFDATLQALYTSVEAVCGLDLRGKIGYLHGDFCEGLEKFRRKSLGESNRSHDIRCVVLIYS